MCDGSSYEHWCDWCDNDGWKIAYIPFRVRFRMMKDGETWLEYDMDTSKDVCRDTISEPAVNENEFISILNAAVPNT